LQQAENFLREDLKTSENEVSKKLPSINQNQFDALVSFVFNVGVGNFRNSTLLKKAKANAGDVTIRAEFARWNKACVNGALKELPGLTRRRKEEADLYFK
jgi:lysozyme